MDSRRNSCFCTVPPAIGSVLSRRNSLHEERGGREKRHLLPVLYLSLLASLVTFFPAPASATGNGITGFSGKNGSTCTQCHSSGTPPTVTMTVPTSVNSGATYTFTLAVKGASGNGGLDVASTSGTFTAGSGTKVQGSELVHSSPNSAHSWTFSWTAPTVTTNTTATIYAAATDGFGGGTGTVVANTTVVAAVTKPTMILAPTGLTFNFQIGGTTPTPQNVAVTSSSTAITYTASTATSWLTTTAGGTTPGSLSIGVNPAGLTAGTYTGSVSVVGTGASNSPLTLPVTFNVTAAKGNPTINLTPSNLSFAYQLGGSNPAPQNLMIASSDKSALSYTAAASGGTWLSIGSTSGSTPGTVAVSVNPAGLTAGSYSGMVAITASGASNSPQSVPVTLTVTSATGGGRLRAQPRWLSFNFGTGQNAPPPKTVSVTSKGQPLNYTVAAFGGSWITVSPSGGTTPGQLSIAVNPSGLPTGTYAGVVQISAAGSPSIDLPVSLNVGTSHGGGGGGDDDAMQGTLTLQAMPAINDPSQSGSVNAKWVSGAGVPNEDLTDPQNQGLLILKSSSASTKASAGVVIANVDGTALTTLGYDIRNGAQCTGKNPAFVVVTSDGVTHVVGGCAKGNKQSSPAPGWMRLRFDPSNPAQATPPIATGATVKSIHLVLDEGPDVGNGMVVLDNILINRTVIGKQ